MIPKKWKTIWTGEASTGTIIETNTDLSKIKGIRFSVHRDNSVNQLFQPDIKAFLEKKQVETSNIRLEWNSVVKFIDLALTLQDIINGKIKIDKSDYCYKYTSDASFTWKNNFYLYVNRIEIMY